MGVLRLSIATTDYDHFRDFRLGAVRAQGIEHVWSVLSHHEVKVYETSELPVPRRSKKNRKIEE